MKKVVILSGCQGSGKSTYAQKLIEQSGGMICSADPYFMKDGEYKFDITKLGEAHAFCLRCFISYCLYEVDRIIVDNTNGSVEEIAPYYSIAKAYDYEVELVTLVVEPEKAFARNLHGVPLEGVQKKAAQIAAMTLPPYWDVKNTILYV